MENFNFLITGVSADIGFGLVRIIRSSFPGSRIIGSDVSIPGAASVFVDNFILVSRADSLEYPEEVMNICKTDRVDFVIPTSEAEINSFWRNGIVKGLTEIGCKVLILPEDVVNVCLDKLETCNLISKNGLRVPVTRSLMECIGLTSKDLKFPLILKPRSAQGSKGLNIIENSKQYDHFLRSFNSLEYEDYIVQQWLDGTQGEFTCCAYKFNREIRTICFKRELGADGGTSNGVVYENEEIDEYIRAVAACFEFEGGINIQLRIHDGHPVLFEINPRFSSTVVFRHKLGFQDFIWDVLRLSKGEIGSFAPVKQGIRFYRGYHEYFGE